MHIAFVSSALSPENAEDRDSFDFFAILLAGVVRQAQRLDHRVSVYVPQKKGATDSDQGIVLRSALTKDFDAIIVAPFETGVVVSELESFFEKMRQMHPEACKARQLPIVIIDKIIDATFTVKIPEGVFIKNVICDNKSGGFQAGQILHDYFESRNIPFANRKFMVLTGLQGAEDRVRGFGEAISIEYPDIQVVRPTSSDLNFTRVGARRWMNDQFNKLIKETPSEFGFLNSYNAWGIFACNDEMALGIRHVISNYYRQIRERLSLFTYTSNDRIIDQEKTLLDLRALMFLQDIKIVGFDGIAPAIELIQPVGPRTDTDIRRDPWLIGTISAEMGEQTAKAIDWINLFFHNNQEAVESPSLISIGIKRIT